MYMHMHNIGSKNKSFFCVLLISKIPVLLKLKVYMKGHLVSSSSSESWESHRMKSHRMTSHRMKSHRMKSHRMTISARLKIQQNKYSFFMTIYIYILYNRIETIHKRSQESIFWISEMNLSHIHSGTAHWLYTSGKTLFFQRGKEIRVTKCSTYF